MKNRPSDPRELPGADMHTGNRLIDPVTGYDTTGHEWGGIKELNTPFPKIVIWALALTFIYSMIAWILLPAWPLGRDYTRGLLGLDQEVMAVTGFREMDEARQEWLERFVNPDFSSIAADSTLVARAMPAAERLFEDNCAACHGPKGSGGPGFPKLDDKNWLWSGNPATIADTVKVGINSDHPDTRWAEMPSFDWMDRGDRLALAGYVAELPTGSADHHSAAAVLFEENCVACHGDRGAGELENGAPSLIDAATIYGQDPDKVLETLRGGRRGVMPSWSGRLGPEEINMLALYVSRLPTKTEGPRE